MYTTPDFTQNFLFWIFRKEINEGRFVGYGFVYETKTFLREGYENSYLWKRILIGKRWLPLISNCCLVSLWELLLRLDLRRDPSGRTVDGDTPEWTVLPTLLSVCLVSVNDSVSGRASSVFMCVVLPVDDTIAVSRPSGVNFLPPFLPFNNL